MPRNLTSTQQTNVNATATRPIYIVEWEHSGSTERLSSSGEITYDGNAFTPGGVVVRAVSNGRSATVTVPATATRAGQVADNDWRNGICKVWCIPGAPSDGGTYAAAAGILLIDGIINTSALRRNVVTVQATSKYLVGITTPVLTFDRVCSYLPAPGSTIQWEGDSLALESVTPLIDFSSFVPSSAPIEPFIVKQYEPPALPSIGIIQTPPVTSGTIRDAFSGFF